jgi:hypothetical protein
MNKVEAELIGAVPHRHTHRGAFAPGEVAARLLVALVEDAAAEGAKLVLVDRAPLADKLARLANVDRQGAGTRPVLCGLARVQRKLRLIMPEAAPANPWHRNVTPAAARDGPRLARACRRRRGAGAGVIVAEPSARASAPRASGRQLTRGRCQPAEHLAGVGRGLATDCEPVSRWSRRATARRSGTCSA